MTGVITRGGVLAALPADHLDELMALAREVSFPAGTRIIEEGSRADRFWVIRSGSVALDIHVPGRRPAMVEEIGAGELLGWSWLLPPRHWHLGAEAQGLVWVYEFDGGAVRGLCRKEPVLGMALAIEVADAIAQRLMASRTRLLDLYGPNGSGPAW
ncbi:cyclic nucleotide-binding domain-containing protein [Streptomyces sp. NPDC047108]|uniref:cyclic nucleotide-binding domain-containing protein n=1 Tax=Streptomyces sp. NPDC047108 TaxID=3155025 RepID=UPI0033DBBA08